MFKLALLLSAKLSISLFLLCLVVACSRQNYAPVVNGWHEPISKQGVHIVQKQETLYAIAWRYGYDYRKIAQINHISAPYTIKAGQAIYLVSHDNNLKTKPHLTSKPTKSRGQAQPSSQKFAPNKSTKYIQINNKVAIADIKKWQWPIKGPIKANFSADANNTNKGINIAGKYGSSIKTAAAGEVVYSGNGLVGYGNLIIIKHNDNYLSAYAYNRSNLVKEGARVKAGQKIAEMGYATDGQAILHFEIRKNGNPVDPLKYLS